ncbi:UROD/MetE-like protein [Trametes versicolor FP-101664 SS1]|uniref:UROD/MetE-like protein n=1 Tax=Trametes versicolor (strain FP-101664) TaxID=717944 RepID=UPI0004622F00|nr:UROD/MetE-like protein [Trametes versicolor FP-101664 SS1]EIW54777.1 UROD/MetE-like protein [Trametes versicolor FP-101664 SS1]
MFVSRAEHVGSLKRPDVLLQKRSDFQAGKCTTEELKAVEDESIVEAVRIQLNLGLDTITDGEYRRTMFYDGLFDCLDGFNVINDPPQHLFQKKLERTKPLYGEAFDFLKKLAGPENLQKLKLTLGAPEWYHFRHGKYTYESTAYANDDDYFADLIKIYRDEFRDLYSRGCRHIQIDDPILVSFCDEKLRQLMLKEAVDPEALLDTYIRVLNGCIAEKPSDLLVSVHICRGNVRPDRQPFIWGPYNRIAKKLFNDLKFEQYYLEYDTERAGTFEPLQYLPRNKHVVLGLVSTKSPELEDPVVLRGRIMDAAEVIARGEVPRSVEEALDQLSISTQCGFASHAPGFAAVTYEDMVKKLTLVRDVARTVWGAT